MELFTQITWLASSAAESKDIFTSLGIDWTLLAVQMVAFLILVALLGKYVYPVFTKVIDERQEQIEASTKAAEAAQEHAETAQVEVEKLLATARKEAKEIVATAKLEASSSLEAAEKKATSRAQKIVDTAHEQIQKDILAAKKALHNETLELVAVATEKIIGQKMDAKTDKALIETSVKDAK